MPSSHLILCRPLLLLPPIHPSIRVFSNESTLHMRWPKYWSFSFSIIPSKEISGLIFRMDLLDLLAVQGTLKSLLQHHSSKASIKCFPGGAVVKNLLSIQEKWIQSLGWEDPLEGEMATTAIFLPGKSHEQRNLVGYHSWGCKESYMT